MREDDARRFLLVRSVESEDRAEALLTREDRQQAQAAALSERQGAVADTGKRADEEFLRLRSEFAFGRLATRFPAVERGYRAIRWPSWINWALPAAALLGGLFANEIDSGRRLNVIAFPLLGMLVWNLAVYALIAVGAARGLASRRRGARPPGLLARPMQWIAGLSRDRSEPNQPIGRALADFARNWALLSGPISRHRANRVLHLSAAALAAGVVAGMYLRALGFEYRAGWESTFIDTVTLHGLLGAVLGPASAITGIDLPTAERLGQMRWGAGGTGESAGPWIHLYAATAFLFIILPRLLLASWSAAGAARLRRNFPVPGREDFYVRRLLRSASGRGAEVRIVPYSFHPPQWVRQNLYHLLGEVLGETMRADIDPPIEYGAEDEWLAAANLGGEADYLLLLFSLSATPEAENQGALVAGLQRRLREAGRGTALAVMIEESAYRQRLAHLAGARIESRRLAWERVLAQHGVTPLSVDLEASPDPALVQRIEAGLLQGPTMAAARSR